MSRKTEKELIKIQKKIFNMKVQNWNLTKIQIIIECIKYKHQVKEARDKQE